ncbi:hypothetical protein KQI86_07205 [Clostridium sp. MSJ-11]|uniref:Uncharacterized protein n=1 Tax=Clostridium mobile TaxID=2841512 RepID=A0ABS6EFX3_9CLOT|nr:hypothetical protein [Clostridium mobile]MBU5484113.1 hypothetical protein [Clostridium mobile]
MNDIQKNDLFYVCCLIEFIGRKSKNRRSTIVQILGKKELARQLDIAEVNHCLSFEQVSDEISDFDSSVYYSNPEYLKYSYLEEKLLE